MIARGDLGVEIPIEQIAVVQKGLMRQANLLGKARQQPEKVKQVLDKMKTDGILAVVEFNKIDGPPGPPLHIRLSPEEVSDMLDPYGFKELSVTDVGPYNYLMQLRKSG